ncbi:hypothetical protein [Seinonella peptonophila]|uniref:hypothetical protein n=1 Tax=Seinonella peptonophila TaxID=112248 RepID=UPI000935318C|nr:hypothetical protein [Seinonella peptonophila]
MSFTRFMMIIAATLVTMMLGSLIGGLVAGCIDIFELSSLEWSHLDWYINGVYTGGTLGALIGIVCGISMKK